MLLDRADPKRQGLVPVGTGCEVCALSSSYLFLLFLSGEFAK